MYDEAEGFRAFIAHGGNPALYGRTIAGLRELHASIRPAAVLDVGCGDGRVTGAVLGPWTRVADLVEPSRALLDRAVEAVARGGAEVRAHAVGAGPFLAGAGPESTWDLVQSTFALHALPPEARRGVLAALAPRARAIAVVEFDVPAVEDGSDARLAHLAERYAHGIAEYRDHPAAVAGFLMPVLVGQVEPGRPRVTWEVPADRWAADLRDAGFTDVGVAPVADYWWAPAVMVRGVTARHGAA